MIPTEEEAKALWDRYNLPDQKRAHVALVAKVAVYLAEKCQKTRSDIHINIPLLRVSAILHDIDKAIQKREGEYHPDTGVRVLREEDMGEVADVVATHSLHAILDPTTAPNTWEQKLLYLADKMVKYEVIGVDKRFDLWRAEDLPQQAKDMLEASYPKVKALEKEIFSLAGTSTEDVLASVR